MSERDWLEEIRAQIFEWVTPYTVSLHQARVMFREIESLRIELGQTASERDMYARHADDAAASLEAERRHLAKLCDHATDIEREWEDGSITSDGMAFCLNSLIRDAATAREALTAHPRGEVYSPEYDATCGGGCESGRSRYSAACPLHGVAALKKALGGDDPLDHDQPREEAP